MTRNEAEAAAKIAAKLRGITMGIFQLTAGNWSYASQPWFEGSIYTAEQWFTATLADRCVFAINELSDSQKQEVLDFLDSLRMRDAT